jgi:hypothetical protein
MQEEKNITYRKPRSRQKCVGCGRWVRRLIWTHDSEGLCVKCANETKLDWVEGEDGEWYALPQIETELI